MRPMKTDHKRQSFWRDPWPHFAWSWRKTGSPPASRNAYCNTKKHCAFDLLMSKKNGADALLRTGCLVLASETNNLQLRREVEQRKADNATARSILEKHSSLWAQVGGMTPQRLLKPTLADIEEARRCCEDIQEIKAHDDRHGLSDCRIRVSAPHLEVRFGRRPSSRLELRVK